MSDQEINEISDFYDSNNTINPRWQELVEDLARRVGRPKSYFRGNMLTSKEYIGGYEFLDGATGPAYKEPGKIFIKGKRATAYLLYHLKTDPKKIFNDSSIPSFEDLEKELGVSHFKRTLFSGTSTPVKSLFIDFHKAIKEKEKFFYRHLEVMTERRSQFSGVDCFTFIKIPYSKLVKKIKRPKGKFSCTIIEQKNIGRYAQIVFRQNEYMCMVPIETLSEPEQYRMVKDLGFEVTSNKEYSFKYLKKTYPCIYQGYMKMASENIAAVFYDVFEEPPDQQLLITANVIKPNGPWGMKWENEVEIS